MPNAFAPTPKNPWGIQIPAAAYGAAQLPIPQPATVGEAKTDAFRDRLRAAMWAQLNANAEAREARDAERDARPYAPPGGQTVPGAADQPRREPKSASADVTHEAASKPNAIDPNAIYASRTPEGREAGAASWDDAVDKVNAERGLQRPAAIDPGAIYASRTPASRDGGLPPAARPDRSPARDGAAAWGDVFDKVNAEKGHAGPPDPGAVYAARRAQTGERP